MESGPDYFSFSPPYGVKAFAFFGTARGNNLPSWFRAFEIIALAGSTITEPECDHLVGKIRRFLGLARVHEYRDWAGMRGGKLPDPDTPDYQTKIGTLHDRTVRYWSNSGQILILARDGGGEHHEVRIQATCQCAFGT